MTLPALTVIPAGAGSGKTYTLEKTLGRWVHDGLAAPERIIAVTFTEAAAGELSSRVRQELVHAQCFEDALRLDQAYISTIHGFGLRLLKEFVFEAGLSPAPRLLTEGEEDAFIRLALARTDKADPVLRDLKSFGYAWDFNSGKRPEDKFRDAVLVMTCLLRNLDRVDADPTLVDAACAWVRHVYGPTGDGEALTGALHCAVCALLKKFPDCLAEIANGKTTVEKAFRDDHRNLLAAQDRARLECDWGLWQSLRVLRQSKRGCPTPEGYDDLAQAVMEAAEELPGHPGPLAQAETHLRVLLESGQDVLARHPRGAPAPLDPLEVLNFPETPKRGAGITTKELQPVYVARRVRALLDDPDTRVIDRRTKAERRIRGSDIAILCPTHTMLADHARELRALGVRVRLEETGWLASRPVQLALHALDYVADAEDRHAALYMAVTELGASDLQSALRELCDDRLPEDAVLAALDAVRAGPPDRSLADLATDVVEALDLLTIVEAWPQGDQCRADLVRLLAEADAFDAVEDAALAGAGLFGRDARVFRAWLAARAEADDGRPAARVRDDDAVALVTWHAAKGREWPVTAVAGLERKVAPRLPRVDAHYDGFDDLAVLLPTARLRWSPEFAAPESTERFRTLHEAAEEEGARRLLYVALTRARDRLILAWPSWLEDKGDMTFCSVLRDAASARVASDGFGFGDTVVHCRVESLPAVPSDDEEAEEPAEPAQRPFGRRAVAPAPMPEGLTPDSVAPSGAALGAEGPVPAVEVISYAPPLTLATDLPPAERGTLVHRCLEALPQGATPERLAAALVPAPPPGDLDAVAERSAAFEAWLEARFAAARIHREVPVLALDERGSVVNGTIDLLVETDAGLWILDHKTETPADPAAAFAAHQGQLSAYADALRATKPEAPVLGVGIHWPLAGVVGVAVLP